MSQPTDLTTSAAVKTYANLGSVADAVLDPLVSAASLQFLTNTRRGLNFINAQTTSEVRDGTGTDSMMLYNYPVISIQLLAFFGVAVPPATPQVPVGYFINLDSGLLTLGAGGYPNLSPSGGWGAPGCFPRGRGTVQINYTYGYTAIPLDVVQAVNEMVLFLYKKRDHIDKDSDSLAQQAVKYKKTWPQSVLDTMDYYARKRRVP